jgi:predicted ArsR family transcriptional regulator
MKPEITTNAVHEYLIEHPFCTLEEISDALGLSGKANALYHIRKLATRGLVQPCGGKHRMYKIVEVK